MIKIYLSRTVRTLSLKNIHTEPLMEQCFYFNRHVLLVGTYTLTISENSCKHYELYIWNHNTELLGINIDLLGKIEISLTVLFRITLKLIRTIGRVCVEINVVQITMTVNLK